MGKELSTDDKGISTIISSIADGSIVIPPLQRKFVWKKDKIKGLMESIYQDYPIGSILLWEARLRFGDSRTIAGFKGPKLRPDFPINYVLDGQQRLSSLYGVFSKSRMPAKKDSEYVVDPNLFEIWFDVDVKKFVHESEKENGKTYFEVKHLFDTSKMFQAMGSYSNPQKKVVEGLFEAFSTYKIPIITTKKRTVEEVGNIFERINNRAAKLDLFDLMVAFTWQPGFHLRTEFKKIYKVLKRKEFHKVKEKVLLQCMSVIISKSSKAKVIVSLDPKIIKKNMKLLAESMKRTVDFLSTQLQTKSDELLPHSHQLVPLCYFFSKVKSPKSDQLKSIMDWFWKTSFSSRYASGTDVKIDEDVALFDKVIKSPTSKAFNKLSHQITSDILILTKFDRRNAYSRAFVLLMANCGPKSLHNGQEIDCGEALSGFNRKEYHHIFPKAFLSRKDRQDDDIDSLCNICILPAAHNKKISDQPPSVYFPKIPTADKKDILDSNLLPRKDAIYKGDEYDEFLRKRAEIIIDTLEEKLN